MLLKMYDSCSVYEKTACHIAHHPEGVSQDERAENAHLLPLAVLTEKYFIRTFWQTDKETVAQRNKLLQP